MTRHCIWSQNVRNTKKLLHCLTTMSKMYCLWANESPAEVIFCAAWRTMVVTWPNKSGHVACDWQMTINLYISYLSLCYWLSRQVIKLQWYKSETILQMYDTEKKTFSSFVILFIIIFFAFLILFMYHAKLIQLFMSYLIFEWRNYM